MNIIYAISGLINAISIVALGTFVYFRNRKRTINKKYFIFCAFAGFWSFNYFLWQISRDSATALFYCRGLMAGSIFIPICFLDFTLVLLSKRQDKYKKRILYSGYILFFSFFVLNFTALFVKGVSPKLFFKFWPEPGIFYTLFLFLWFLYCVYAIYLLYRGYKKATGSKRNQIKYVLVAIVIGYVSGSTNYFLWYDIPIPPFGNFIVPLFVAIMAYSIVKHNLLDINVVFRKTLMYSIIIGFLFTVSVITLFILAQFFGGFFPQKTFWLTLFLVCILSLLFQPVYRRSTSLVDKLFFKGTLPKIAEELQRSEKLAALGVIASGLAHEIKNPLVPIKTYIQNLPNNINNPNFIDKITRVIPNEVDKITDIINQLRNFAQPPPLSISEVDIHNLIDKRLSLLEQDFTSKNILVEKDYCSSLPVINADPVQLERVFLNLFLNSIDAMPNGGKLRISTEYNFNNSVLIKVSDTGIGIAKEDLPYIFDPFYSKGKHRGTGLGLAVSYQAIKNHSGTISVESRINKGSIFSIYLPSR